MPKSKKKGYRVERKVRLFFEKYGWKVIRAGGSLGEADLVCFKGKKALFLQIKSTKKPVFYYYGLEMKKLEGFPFLLVVDFGYGNTKVIYPKSKIRNDEGTPLEDFLLLNTNKY